ncbi:CHASE2 domain-containing protein [Verrucomicrobium sp. 3C]|uniref:CHASE2 domain-containing protein n=1 Tax=Verrucomicrobium sp. 3C TaxID=1134055 RepID=UPI00037A6BE9|nr:CHASE2 domain-containing protein [Verrucomicrobium sp. 3C]
MRTDEGAPSAARSGLQRNEKKSLRVAGLLASLWSILLTIFAYQGVLSGWENKVTRWEEIPPSESKSSHFALIAIDHIPADRPWPWPRLEYALCLRGLLAQIPQSVVFEVLLSEKGTKMSSFDQTFASLVRRMDHVCFAADALLGEQQGEPLPLGAMRLQGSTQLGNLTEYRSVIWPGITFAGENPVGLANLDVGSEEVLSLPLVFRVKEALVPSLALQAAAVYLGADLGRATVRLGHAIILRDRRGKRIRTIPVDAEGRIAVRYRRSPKTIPRLGYDSYLVYANQATRGQLSEDELPPLRGRQVWIGVTDEAIVPKMATPVGPMTPVELQMQVSRQIVEGELIHPLPWFLTATVGFALCLWGTRLFVTLPALSAISAIAILFAGTIAVSVTTFFFVGLALPLCTLLLAAFGAVICGTAVRLWNFSPFREERTSEKPSVVVEVAASVPPLAASPSDPVQENPVRSPSAPAESGTPASPSLARLQGALRRLEERRRREGLSGESGRLGQG